MLRALHVDVDAHLRLADRMTAPAVNHSFLLYKSGPGPATRSHQDRPYWTDIEPTCTMFTVWIALGDIDARRGALMLNPANEVAPDRFFEGFRTGTLLDHRDDNYGGGGFTITLPDDIAESLKQDMDLVPVKAGDIVVFDAFEPHCSSENSDRETRLAMKIVYGEANSMKSSLITVKKLAGKGLLSSLMGAFTPKH